MKVLKRFFINLNRLFYWLPIIWETREYDYTYTLILIRHQLQRQLDFFNNKLKNKPVAYHEQDDINILKECIRCLDIIIEDDFVNRSFEELEFFKQRFFTLFKKHYTLWWD